MRERAESLFFKVQELVDPVVRSEFLEEACAGAPELRAKVEALLAAEDEAEAYFGATVLDDEDCTTWVVEPGAPGRSSEHAGGIIGAYKLVEKLGEGGFGSVWLAEQSRPVKRQVALKILKQGMDTREVITRFEAERQALAMMEHPNIAKVFDAGATEKGRPYFVMELVRGMPVTQYCAEQKLTTRQRLDLFGDICAAVNHAHQKGIIHRDLKPSNVLVSLQGEKPSPKVIDFGIAKATDSKLTEQTLFTRHDQFIGTPAYMSPEQASLGGQDVDTRADIYSLGVLLYELLSGKPPFDPKTLLSAGYDEMRRIILEEDPPKPSLRVSTANATEQVQITGTHGTDTQRLERTLKGDLDWIVMKAIEKDRSRRYETANDLAADIGRYMANEPVSAAAPSVSYLFSKFARRHRAAIWVAGTFAVVLLAATGISAWLAIRATTAERRVTGLLDESKIRQEELREAVDGLRSHMEAFVIGTWDFRYELDRERGLKEMGADEWRMFEGFFTDSIGDFSSKLQFKEDGSALGATIAPPMLQALTPHEHKQPLQDGEWELITLKGKRTTVKVTSRGLGGIKHSTEFTVTVIDSDTLEMENAELKDKPFKPFTFKRVQVDLD